MKNSRHSRRLIVWLSIAAIVVITMLHELVVYGLMLKAKAINLQIEKLFVNSAVNSIVYVAVIIVVLLFVFSRIRRKNSDIQSELEKMAFTDSITGGPSYNKFVLEVEKRIVSTRMDRYVFLRVSPKNFAIINETFGYNVGNTILKEISDIISDELSIRKCFCRCNDEDFLLLLEYDGQDKLVSRLEGLYSDLINQRTNEKFHISIFFNAGAYLIDKNETEPLSTEILTDRATLAMKSIVRGVGNCFAVYTDKLRDDTVLESRLDYDMRSALENKEFIIHIQPKYSLKTNEIVSAEALVRWMHPQLGVIQPNSFIPVAERNGMVVDIDFYVMDTVCRKIREWTDRGILPVPISVNQSRLHLTDENYTVQLISVLQKYDIPPELIELETTETVFFNDNALMLRVMEQLHKIGFLISMDDFGSGYSSLNMLKEIPVDVLKLDRVFFGVTAETERGKIVIAHIIAMAKALNMVVVAEGVEKPEQAEFLRAIGCDMAQGFLFSRPLPIDLFEAEAFGRMEVDFTAFT